ncbi:MAG: hypothetical protein HY360_11760 [Verrucomicrobia bacterium]|nr:hypothetical protein [Verrucomicrobiota bacterium]
MIPRPDLLDSRSPPMLEIFQLTTETVPSCHVYMEAQIFTPDSKRLVLHRSAHAHGSDRRDPEHRYLLCDLEHEGQLSPLTVETGATAPCVSPEGRWFYYFVDETEVGGGRLTLKRVELDGSSRETLCVVDAPIKGTLFRPSWIYPICTISSDGRRIALPSFLGDGQTEHAPWGLMVFDIEEGLVTVPWAGPEWGNLHSQYCRALDPEHRHDIMIQHDHGNHYAPDGICRGRHTARYDSADQRLRPSAVRQGTDPASKFTGLATDIHVIRDDGTCLRSLPWGRDGNEFAQGHQCWRGRTPWTITSTLTENPAGEYLIESQAVASDRPHNGARIEGSIRNDLGRNLAQSHFFHFATDILGRWIISDYGEFLAAREIWLGELGKPGRDPARWTFLLDTRGPVRKETQLHPFLSPDGRFGFFNSAETGLLQAYMIADRKFLSPMRGTMRRVRQRYLSYKAFASI